jgi:hypothetical protein
MISIRARLIFLAAAIFALCGCDGLSKIENESAQTLTVRYWHKDYDRWSRTMRSGPGQNIHVPPGHHFRDVSCLEIVEGSRRFVYDNLALQGVQTLCQKANACKLSYLGEGRLRVTGKGGSGAAPDSPLPSDKLCRS